MAVRKIKEGVEWLGSIDWDRRLFDELIPLPEGTSYNAYLVRGSEKTALIDTVDPPKAGELLENLHKAGIRELDYIVAHHGEQDHSGSIPAVLEQFPAARVVANPRCREILQDLLHLPGEKFLEVADREKLSLGDKTLEFIYTPWVHWPETMVTYLHEERILFSCDFFGSHLATSQMFVEEEGEVYRAAKRYYAEIMMPFRAAIKKNMEKIGALELNIIAPSHGPLHNNPAFIMDAYRDWISDKVKNEVLVLYISMHGSTGKMVDFLVDTLLEKDIVVKPFNLSVTDIGELAMSLVDAATVVLASPTVLVGPHPQVVYAAFLANALRPKLKYAAVIGSFGWGSKMLEQLTGMVGNLKVELFDPVIIKGFPREEDYRVLEKLAGDIVKKHEEDPLVEK